MARLSATQADENAKAAAIQAAEDKHIAQLAEADAKLYEDYDITETFMAPGQWEVQNLVNNTNSLNLNELGIQLNYF